MVTAPGKTYDDSEMAQFVRRAEPHVFNGYGHNLLTMGTDTLNSTFSASVMNVLDQDYLTAVAESDNIQETLDKNIGVYDVVQAAMETMREEGNKPPQPAWVTNDESFRNEMRSRADRNFVEGFSATGKLDTESRAMFDECMKEFGPKSFGMLNDKLGQLQNRKGELMGLLDEIQDAFERNSPRIMARWGVTSPEEIMAVGIAEGIPRGLDPKDSLQLGRLVLEALKNPEFSKVDLLSVETAIDFRNKYVRDVAAENTANFGNPQLGALQADPNGRFAPPPGTIKTNTELGDDGDPNNPNAKTRLRVPMPGMGGGF